MKNRLIQLRNLLSMIETKGNSTLVMAETIRFVEETINECEKYKKIESDDATE